MGDDHRSIGLIGATTVGVGAIVGGGIFVLAGVAFAATGPAAIAAFAINGVIAALTALSFAEMSSAFPESGGAYSFAKRVLSIHTAFAVGWILWFAYIVATVLYALGFASYAAMMVVTLWESTIGDPPAWLGGRQTQLLLALAAAAIYTRSLTKKAAGGGDIATYGKLVVFLILIAAGFWVLMGQPSETTAARMSPFLPGGTAGLLAAMGFTFIAVQGFDLISAIAGEVKEPKKTIPKAMLLSLATAMVVYLPLLFLVVAVGANSGQDIVQMSEANPETVMAIAARNYLGPTGYWLVIVAAILSTLSALRANFMAASRVAMSMARDRTLPRALKQLHESRHTPVAAVYATAITIAALLILLPDLSSAGAAASLIFLISFALAHVTSYLARRRGLATHEGFLTPLFPLVPAVAGLACATLAVFQAVVVPSAGAITLAWLILGVGLYIGLFATRAEAIDARAEAQDPSLVMLRGRSPLVLAPVANPKTARALVDVANALAPPTVGRVLLLSVVVGALDTARLGDERPPQLLSAQEGQREALLASIGEGKAPEALMTLAPEAWSEIARVARSHRCESLLLGFTSVPEDAEGSRLEELLGGVDCDVSVLRAPAGWKLSEVKRILVPVGGRGGHDALRARLLASLGRATKRETTFLRVVPQGTPALEVADLRSRLRRLAEEEATGRMQTEVVESPDIGGTIVERAAQSDLVVLGLQRVGRKRKAFGPLALRIARETSSATIMIGRRG